MSGNEAVAIEGRPNQVLIDQYVAAVKVEEEIASTIERLRITDLVESLAKKHKRDLEGAYYSGHRDGYVQGLDDAARSQKSDV